MGTNYYLHSSICDSCGRSDTPVHLGKSSEGWAFLLRVYPERGLNSLEDFLPDLLHGQIEDEYGHVIQIEDMLEFIFDRDDYVKRRTDVIRGPYHVYDRCDREFC